MAIIIGLQQHKEHEVQRQYWDSAARFNVISAGRRSGKTELFKRKLSLVAGFSLPGSRYFAGAPTRDQAKKIFWNDLCRLAPPKSDKKISELCIIYPNEVEIWILGMDKPERIEGSKWNGGGLDEYGNMRPETWPEHVRPSLADTSSIKRGSRYKERFHPGGWCDFLGVPEGRNHYFKLNQKALEDTSGTWAAFTWHSADVLPEEEIRQAKHDLDERTFRQEYEAEFLDFADRVYYAFSEETHVRKLEYNPKRPLIVCFDFNVSPGVAAICQEFYHEGEWVTGVIDEVWIQTNSNTRKISKKICEKYINHQSEFHLYGDSTGGAKGTAKILGTDWDIIKREFWDKFTQSRVKVKVKKSNPLERDRVNAVNSRLRSFDGTIRAYVDKLCIHVIDDLSGVGSLPDGSIDKKSSPMLTHLSDSIGYYIEYKFPITQCGASNIRIIAQ